MIVTDTLTARAEVDRLSAEQPGFEDHIFGELSAVVREKAESFGYFVGKGSTFMKRGRASAGTFLVPFFVYWCPDPTLGVEFRGGPNDGKVAALPREDDGRPPEAWRLMPEPAPPTISDFREQAVQPQLVPIRIYERVGIDSVLDRWIYRTR